MKFVMKTFTEEQVKAMFICILNSVKTQTRIEVQGILQATADTHNVDFDAYDVDNLSAS